jgi:hypothetical protein
MGENIGTKNGKAKGPVDSVDEEKKKRRQERCRALRKLLLLVVRTSEISHDWQ